LSGEITHYAVTLQGAGGRLQSVIHLDVAAASGSTDLAAPRVVLTFVDAPPADNIVFGGSAVLMGAGVQVVLAVDAFATVIHLLQTERPVFVAVSESQLGLLPRRSFTLATSPEALGEGDQDTDASTPRPPPPDPPPFRPTPDPSPIR
jgi:hypothetical protein